MEFQFLQSREMLNKTPLQYEDLETLERIGFVMCYNNSNSRSSEADEFQ